MQVPGTVFLAPTSKQRARLWFAGIVLASLSLVQILVVLLVFSWLSMTILFLLLTFRAQLRPRTIGSESSQIESTGHHSLRRVPSRIPGTVRALRLTLKRRARQ